MNNLAKKIAQLVRKIPRPILNLIVYMITLVMIYAVPIMAYTMYLQGVIWFSLLTILPMSFLVAMIANEVVPTKKKASN